MRPATAEWLAGLRGFALDHRIDKPLVLPSDPARAAAERMVLAAWLSMLLDGSESLLEARRRWLGASGRREGADAEAALVITTSAVGVAVAEEIVSTGSLPARAVAAQVAAVTELEYRLWCIRNPDTGSARHVTIWNWIKTHVPPQRHAEFARHPLAAAEAYWLHRAGVSGAGEADRRECHLWKWNGQHALLLEACVVEQSVKELR